MWSKRVRRRRHAFGGVRAEKMNWGPRKGVDKVRRDLARTASCIADANALTKQLEAHPELLALLEQERARFAARITELEQERDRLRASHRVASRRACSRRMS